MALRPIHDQVGRGSRVGPPPGALDPQVAATGHGLPMHGGEMRQQLRRLAKSFDRLATPARGVYLRYPAMVRDDGSVGALGAPLSRTLLR
jgi:hypothetical protein